MQTYISLSYYEFTTVVVERYSNNAKKNRDRKQRNYLRRNFSLC